MDIERMNTKEWTSGDVAAVVRAAQKEAGVRIAQDIKALCADVEQWPTVEHLRALMAAATIATDYANRIEPSRQENVRD